MRFLPIPGYPNYQISQDGVVRRQIGPEKFRTVQSTWDNNGHYRIITLWQDGHRQTYMLHHLVAVTHGLSVGDAKRCVYGGYELKPGARDHVRETLARQIEEWLKEPETYHDEILYYQEFLRQLSTETGNKYKE